MPWMRLVRGCSVWRTLEEWQCAAVDVFQLIWWQWYYRHTHRRSSQFINTLCLMEEVRKVNWDKVNFLEQGSYFCWTLFCSKNPSCTTSQTRTWPVFNWSGWSAIFPHVSFSPWFYGINPLEYGDTWPLRTFHLACFPLKKLEGVVNLFCYCFQLF